MKSDLSDFLLKEGIIGDDAYKEVKKLREKTGARVDQILLRKGIADEETVVSAIAKQYDYEFRAKVDFHEDKAFEAVPVEFVKRSRIVPIKKKQDTIEVILRDPSALQALDDLQRYLKEYHVQFLLTVDSEITRIIHTHYDEASRAAQEVMDGITSDDFADLDSLSEDSLDMANEAPIIRMVNAILSQGIQERASDIHIEPYEKILDVRYRIDGILHRRLTPPRAIHAGLVSRIKIMSNLNIAENRLPQDGRIKLKIQGKDIDIRVSTFPTRYGERIVMRLLNKSDMNYSLDSMGFDSEVNAQIRELIKEPNGILLVTGPTGSGKTTTLYSFLTELNQESRNILTAEDPVEYEMEGVSQLQVQEKIGLTFAFALRSMLRQDPDVIMVGEIRDQETARIAVQASLTGHLVLSTLHTNDAASAVTRLMDMGVEPYLITSTVRAVLAQRLVRRICPSCKKAYKPDVKELAGLQMKASDLKGGVLYRGEGCDECVGTGYRGRMGIYELFMMNTEIQRAIIKGADSDVLKELAIKSGMRVLSSYGKDRVIDGETTLEEVMRVT